MKGWKIIFQANGMERKVGVALLELVILVKHSSLSQLPDLTGNSTSTMLASSLTPLKFICIYAEYTSF